jgi:hypothetical protein
MHMDDAHQVAEATKFWQKLDAMVAVAAAVKKYDATHTQVLAAPHS